jgi:hypothetical protein
MDREISPEKISAFIDGELPPKEMERIAAYLAERPDLESEVSQQEHLRTQLRSAFSEVLDGPVPAHLLQAARTAPVSLRWRLQHLLQARSSWQVLVPAGAALAVGLVIGLLLRAGADVTSNASGQLIARGALRRALDHQLASETSGRSRIGITFRDQAGEDCRTFLNGASSGLACHRGGAWIISIMVHQPAASPGADYRMAGSEMPPAVRDAVTTTIAGEPFNAQAERAARDSGWK